MSSTKTSVTIREPTARSDAQYLVALIAAPDVRDGLARRLELEGIAFHSFDDVNALQGECGEDSPPLILLFAGAIGSATLAHVAQLTDRFATSPLILVCAEINRWEARATLGAGAAGIVLLTDIDSALGPSIYAVLSGQTCVPRNHRQQIDPPPLSSREKQILGLVVMGFMNGQIAEQLFLAESTVKSHLSSAFAKLGVRSRNEAVNLILDPERGLGMGILALGGERLDATIASAR